MRSFQQRLAGFACACIALPMLAAAAEPGDYLLSDYLDELNRLGQVVIYSSDLVTDDMRIAGKPASVPAPDDLNALLRPFGLTSTEGPSGSLLIVRASEPSPADEPADAVPAAIPIPEIVVTSSLHRLDYSHPTTHTYLDRELATRIPTTADEAVRLTDRLPGTATGGVSARNHVRGGVANEVLFLFDGLRLYEPYHL